MAVVLEMRGQINDEDVAVAVQLALRSLTHNSRRRKTGIEIGSKRQRGMGACRRGSLNL